MYCKYVFKQIASAPVLCENMTDFLGKKHEDLPEDFVGFHESHSISDGLYKVVMSRNFTGDNGELLPIVSCQNRKHGGNLML